MSILNNTAVRLILVAVILAVTFGVAAWEGNALKPGEVQLPSWTFNELPMQLGEWRGEATTLDPKIAAATGASIIVDRTWSDAAGHSISMHTAMFKDPADGVFHTPINCYRANGYQDTDLKVENLPLSSTVTLPVHLSQWERKEGKAEKLFVVYWYQIGDHVLFDRMDLGLKVRWQLARLPRWPALIKVMLQMSYASGDEEKAKEVLLAFTKQLAQWENQPKHDLLLHGDSAATPPVSTKSAPAK